MAIRSEELNVGSTQDATKSTKPRRSFLAGGGLFAAAIAPGIGSEIVSKIAENLAAIYQKPQGGYKIDLTVIDRANEPALAYSIIAVTVTKASTDVAATHVLIIEASGEPLTPIYENIAGQQQIEILRLASDAFDPKLIDIVRRNVMQALPTKKVTIVDGCVVPQEFNPEDKQHMHLLALNTVLAGATEVEMRSDDFVDINLVEEKSNANMIVDVNFEHRQLTDAVGLPMRSDAIVQFRTQKIGQNVMQSVHSFDRDVTVSNVSGFIEMLYAPSTNPMGGMGNPWQQQVFPTQTFASRFVITNLASTVGYTPGMVLLTIATSLVLNNNGMWILNYRPQATSDKDVDIYDIGVLNIEGKLDVPPQDRFNPNVFGQVPDTKSRDFNLDQLFKFVTALVHPGIMVAIDVPDCGPQTWYTSLFRDASNGSTHATELIYSAASQLTNGIFDKYFPQGAPMFTDVGNRVHLGYYVDKAGNRRDIRDIDYIAVGNLIGKTNPEYLVEWSNTFLRQDYPLAYRLAKRKAIIDNLTGMSAVYKGYATRVTFSADFLAALMRACAEAGFVPYVKAPLSTVDMMAQRGVATFATSALLPPTAMFGTNAFGQYSAQAFNRMPTARW